MGAQTLSYPYQEHFTLSQSQMEDCREQQGCSGLRSSLRKPSLLHTQVPAGPQLNSRARSDMDLQIHCLHRSNKSQYTRCRSFYFQKVNYVESGKHFYEETERGNKEGKTFVGGTEPI